MEKARRKRYLQSGKHQILHLRKSTYCEPWFTDSSKASPLRICPTSSSITMECFISPLTERRHFTVATCSVHCISDGTKIWPSRVHESRGFTCLNMFKRSATMYYVWHLYDTLCKLSLSTQVANLHCTWTVQHTMSTKSYQTCISRARLLLPKSRGGSLHNGPEEARPVEMLCSLRDMFGFPPSPSPSWSQPPPKARLSRLTR